MLGRDIDLLILENLEDKDLVSYCQVNKKANEICNDQTFWFNRLRSKFPFINLELMAEVKEGSWSDVYIEMVKFPQSVDRWAQWIARDKNKIILFQDKKDALDIASESGFLNIVKYLVKEGTKNLNLSLALASSEGHLDIVKFLLKEGADVDYWNDVPLRHASKNGHLDIVKYLVKNGADIHAADNEGLDAPLRLATQHGHLEVANYLKSI